MLERNRFRASLAALTPNKSFLSISFTESWVGVPNHSNKSIVPYVYMYQSRLAPTGRPAGVFLLPGPTGTGKTQFVNRIDAILTYQPLDQESLEAILEHDIKELQSHVKRRGFADV